MGQHRPSFIIIRLLNRATSQYYYARTVGAGPARLFNENGDVVSIGYSINSNNLCGSHKSHGLVWVLLWVSFDLTPSLSRLRDRDSTIYINGCWSAGHTHIGVIPPPCVCVWTCYVWFATINLFWCVEPCMSTLWFSYEPPMGSCVHLSTRAW